MMALVILGGMCLQYPIGRMSDRHDRRLVILLLCSALTLLALMMVLLPGTWRADRGRPDLFCWGHGVLHHPLSLSHACDELRPDQVLGGQPGAAARHSLGAMIGPLLAPSVMGLFRAAGLFVYCPCAACCSRLSGLAVGGSGPLLAEHQVFMPVPQHPSDGGEPEPRTDLAGAVPASYARRSPAAPEPGRGTGRGQVLSLAISPIKKGSSRDPGKWKLTDRCW